MVDLNTQPHFNRRCRERGIVTADADELFHRLVSAIKSFDPFVDFVMTYNGGRYWRFHCEDGIFYTVTGITDPFPRTILTQSMIRQKKWAHKAKKRGYTPEKYKRT